MKSFRCCSHKASTLWSLGAFQLVANSLIPISQRGAKTADFTVIRQFVYHNRKKFCKKNKDLSSSSGTELILNAS